MNYTVYIITDSNYKFNISSTNESIALKAGKNIIESYYKDKSSIKSSLCFINRNEESDFYTETKVVYIDAESDLHIDTEELEDDLVCFFYNNEI